MITLAFSVSFTRLTSFLRIANRERVKVLSSRDTTDSNRLQPLGKLGCLGLTSLMIRRCELDESTHSRISSFYFL